ncbi:hypothetical protein GF373_06360 [bacterium]|nr:hypothetical protein [bacterium]
MSTEQFNFTKAILYTLMAFVLLLDLIIGVQILFYWSAQSRIYDRNIAQAAQETRDIYAGQQKQLTEYRWINKENEIVAVPIDRAIELVVEKAKQQP